MRASFVLSEIGIGLRRNLTMTIAGVVTVAISLAIFGAGLLAQRQVTAMKDFWYDKVEVSIYLCGDQSKGTNCNGSAVTLDQRNALLQEVNANPLVQKVYYESQQQAYENFKKQFKDSKDLVQNVTPDALPESLRVKLKDPTKYEDLASAFRDSPGVEEIADQKALLDPFFRVLNRLQWVARVVAGIQILAAVLLIANMVRVAAYGRRRETGIMRLVGASNLYIQLPFLLEGILIGVVGAAFAAVGLAVLKAVLVDRLLKPMLQFTRFVGWSDVLAVVPWLFVIGVALTGISSFLTLRRHLRV
ncbi:MAG: cell division transport system permease protein [Actinomycetota bacterium]|jgi:cell division transport system permease protein|nr:cell division transport system permease protein [Actinomycetota bacterium]